jgi:predicted enzyme related to lactoylglutathione lyase
MPRVIHFEVHTDDPKRAIAFYENVFGWKVKKWDGPMDYWFLNTGEDDKPGIDGGIVRRMEQRHTNIVIDVPSVDEYLEKVVDAGGKVLMPKATVLGIGYIGYCEDTEGNAFAIMESDQKAM